MTTPDATREAEIRAGLAGITRYEGQVERPNEFLLRLLDEARAEGDRLIQQRENCVDTINELRSEQRRLRAAPDASDPPELDYEAAAAARPFEEHPRQLPEAHLVRPLWVDRLLIADVVLPDASAAALASVRTSSYRDGYDAAKQAASSAILVHPVGSVGEHYVLQRVAHTVSALNPDPPVSK